MQTSVVGDLLLLATCCAEAATEPHEGGIIPFVKEFDSMFRGQRGEFQQSDLRAGDGETFDF